MSAQSSSPLRSRPWIVAKPRSLLLGSKEKAEPHLALAADRERI